MNVGDAIIKIEFVKSIENDSDNFTKKCEAGEL
jgi:hypothetical protein